MGLAGVVHVKAIVFFLLLVLSLSGRAETASSELFHIINERLSYMGDVALYKAQHHKPIEDIEREQLVINKSNISAKENGPAQAILKHFLKLKLLWPRQFHFAIEQIFSLNLRSVNLKI